MERILAIVIVLVFIWWAAPHVANGEWIAPTAVPPGSWVASNPYGQGPDDFSGYAAASATPPEGYGWFHFDFWKHSPNDSRPVTKSDLRLPRL